MTEHESNVNNYLGNLTRKQLEKRADAFLRAHGYDENGKDLREGPSQDIYDHAKRETYNGQVHDRKDTPTEDNLIELIDHKTSIEEKN